MTFDLPQAAVARIKLSGEDDNICSVICPQQHTKLLVELIFISVEEQAEITNRLYVVPMSSRSTEDLKPRCAIQSDMTT